MEKNLQDTYKEYVHNPPHLFLPDSKYFITGSIYLRKHLLITKHIKLHLIDSIFKGFTDSDWIVEDWVILNNHYHIMVTSPKNANDLGGIVNKIHKFTGILIKKNILAAEDVKKVWHNYWDTCITYEKSYYARLNYIWNNPVKHSYVKDPELWKFGSFYYRFKKEKEYLEMIRKRYPCDRVKVYDDF